MAPALLDRWRALAAGAAARRGLPGPVLAEALPRVLKYLAGAPPDPAELAPLTAELVRALPRDEDTCAELLEELGALGQALEEAVSGGWWTARLARPQERALWREGFRLALEVGQAYVRQFALDQAADEALLHRFREVVGSAAAPDEGPALAQPWAAALRAVVAAPRADGAALHTGSVAGCGERVSAHGTLAEGPPELEERARAVCTEALGRIGSCRQLVLPGEPGGQGARALLAASAEVEDSLAAALCLTRAGAPFSVHEEQRLQGHVRALAAWMQAWRRLSDLHRQVRAQVAEGQLRDRALSMMAHDLRTPLGVARLSAAALARALASRPVEQELAHRIVAAIDRGDRMLRDLLDASRVRAGRALVLTLAPCRLADAVRDALAELVPQFGERFVLEADEEAEGIWSRHDLRRVAVNLGANAVKHGDPQAPVRFTVRRTTRGAALAVHNQGRALTPDERLGLFRSFGQLDPGEKGGWGIGLMLVKGVAEALGGQVRVESAPGLGTTFTVELPLDARPYQAGRAEEPPPAAGPGSAPSAESDAWLRAKAHVGRAAAPACLVDQAGVIQFVNTAWDRFAEENGAPGAVGAAVVGRRWLDCMQGERPRAQAAGLLAQARAAHGWAGTMAAWECNSAETARLVVARFERVPAGAAEPVGVAITYTVLESRDLGLTTLPTEAADEAALAALPEVVLCSSCGRVRHGEGWVFYRPFVSRRPEGARYDFCPACQVAYRVGPDGEAGAGGAAHGQAAMHGRT